MVPFLRHVRPLGLLAAVVMLVTIGSLLPVLAHQNALASHIARPTYAISALPSLGGETSRAFAINNHGDIVGHADDAQGRRRAVLWRGGAVIDLGTLGGDHATAQNITDTGLIVGRSTLAPGGALDDMPTHAFAWRDGQMTDLGTLGGDSSLALAANDSGQIVGESTTTPVEDPPDARTEAFLWENGQMKSLGTLGGSYSSALSITADGQIVGQAETASGAMRAFHWKDGVMTNLGALTGTRSTAIDINASDQIIGGWSRIEGEDRAALWEGHQTIDLGTQQGTWAFALDINDRGWVVGIQEGETSSGQRWGSSFLWIDGEGWDLRELFRDEPQWGFRGANGINDAGQIVGYGTFEGQTRAFVMTPESPSATPGADPCAGHTAWFTASMQAMMLLFDALKATGLDQDATRSLTPDQWQVLLDASKATVTSLDAISPPPAREEWHAAQRQIALVYGAYALAKLKYGNDASGPSTATWIEAIVSLDRAIANAPHCPPSAG